jgi:hypothetical protein
MEEKFKIYRINCVDEIARDLCIFLYNKLKLSRTEFYRFYRSHPATTDVVVSLTDEELLIISLKFDLIEIKIDKNVNGSITERMYAK